MKSSMAFSILLILVAVHIKAQDGIEKLLDTYVYKVVLTKMDEKTVSGQLVYLSDNEIQVVTGHLSKNDSVGRYQVMTFQYNEVKEVFMRRKKGPLIGMVYGMATGGIVGLILSSAPSSGEDYLTDLEATGILIAAGGIIGTICGTFFGKHFKIEGDEAKFYKMYSKIHS